MNDWRDDPVGHKQRVGAYALVLHPEEPHDRVLLVRLTELTPFPGAWSVPGGEVELAEHPADAVIRELHEETGLRGRVTGLLAVDSQARDLYDQPATGAVYHAIRILYRVEVDTAGPLVVHDTDGSSDEPTWFGVGDAATLPLTPSAELALAHLPPTLGRRP